jgi:hypothetical protein
MDIKQRAITEQMDDYGLAAGLLPRAGEDRELFKAFLLLRGGNQASKALVTLENVEMWEIVIPVDIFGADNGFEPGEFTNLLYADLILKMANAVLPIYAWYEMTVYELEEYLSTTPKCARIIYNHLDRDPGHDVLGMTVFAGACPWLRWEALHTCSDMRLGLEQLVALSKEDMVRHGFSWAYEAIQALRAEFEDDLENIPLSIGFWENNQRALALRIQLAEKNAFYTHHGV